MVKTIAVRAPRKLKRNPPSNLMGVAWKEKEIAPTAPLHTEERAIRTISVYPTAAKAPRREARSGQEGPLYDEDASNLRDGKSLCPIEAEFRRSLLHREDEEETGECRCRQKSGKN